MKQPSKMLFVFAAVLGSFSVYCVQSVTQGSNPTANADCTAPATPPEFKELATGISAGGDTDAIDVSQYREVVLQATPSQKSCNLNATTMRFRQADDEVFAYTGQRMGDPGTSVAFVPGGRIRVDGPTMQLSFQGCAIWRVVGVK